MHLLQTTLLLSLEHSSHLSGQFSQIITNSLPLLNYPVGQLHVFPSYSVPVGQIQSFLFSIFKGSSHMHYPFISVIFGDTQDPHCNFSPSKQSAHGSIQSIHPLTDVFLH